MIHTKPIEIHQERVAGDLRRCGAPFSMVAILCFTLMASLLSGCQNQEKSGRDHTVMRFTNAEQQEIESLLLMMILRRDLEWSAMFERFTPKQRILFAAWFSQAYYFRGKDSIFEGVPAYTFVFEDAPEYFSGFDDEAVSPWEKLHGAIGDANVMIRYPRNENMTDAELLTARGQRAMEAIVVAQSIVDGYRRDEFSLLFATQALWNTNSNIVMIDDRDKAKINLWYESMYADETLPDALREALADGMQFLNGPEAENGDGSK